MKNAVFWNQRYVGGTYLNWSMWDLVTTDVEEFQKSTAEYKVGMIGEFLDSYDLYPGFDDLLKKLLSICDKIFIFNTHAYEETFPLILKYNNSKIIWVLPIMLYGSDNVLFDNAWLRSKIEWYSSPELKQDLFDLNPYAVKEFYFDALMHDVGDNKKFVISNVRRDEINTKILSRFGSEPLIYPQEFTARTMVSEPSQYKGHGCLLADVVPVNIYNATAYSILAESTYNNSYFYLTEKSTKCILARRLFVMFAGQYWLRSFQSLGFKTFDSVIDESYDSIEDNQTRWDMAYDQVKYLCGQDQSIILDKIRPILEHNYNHLWHTDWRGILDRQVLGQIAL
jgi:hypothetical protein